MRYLAVVLVLGFQASSYRADVEQYRTSRAEAIGAATGWIALTDLHWLDKTGDFTIGRDSSNAIVLKAPSAPAKLGTLTVTPTTVSLRAAPGTDVRMKGAPTTLVQFAADRPPSEGPTLGGITMSMIERAKRRALRVWDTQGPARLGFRGLHWLPIDEAWNVQARFVPHEPAPIMKIQNIIGQTVEMQNPGKAVFRVGGREYTLEALLESADADELFFMFKDGTSAKTTYGAGRYLYTPLPKNGRVTIDFNRAINPPCAFTDFATCPLPPAANRLTLPIQAGELDYKQSPASLRGIPPMTKTGRFARGR